MDVRTPDLGPYATELPVQLTWGRLITGRIHGIAVPVTTEEVDHKPDNSDEKKQRSKRNEKPESSGHNSTRAVNRGALGEMSIARYDSDVSTRDRLFAKVQIPPNYGHISPDLVAGVDRNASEEHCDIAAHVSVNVDGTEHANEITSVLSLGDSDIAAKAHAVVIVSFASGKGRYRQHQQHDQHYSGKPSAHRKTSMLVYGESVNAGEAGYVPLNATLKSHESRAAESIRSICH
jgi:hypothetical protein